MIIKVNEKNYNILKDDMLGSNEEAKYSFGFLKDSLIGQILEDKNNISLEIIFDNSIEGDKVLFVEDKEVIFESYMCDFLSCMVKN